MRGKRHIDLILLTAQSRSAARDDHQKLISKHHITLHGCIMAFFILVTLLHVTKGDLATQEIQFLNELPLNKLLNLKNSIHEFVSTGLENVTTTAPVYQSFGAEAMAIQAPPPVKRGDYEEVWHKGGGSSKISNIFSMSVTTLAFLAFGGYLLCLIVHAVKNKQMLMAPTTVAPATFFINAGIKKRPQPQFASYGRKRRDNRHFRSLKETQIPPEQLYTALVHLCEGYAKWSARYNRYMVSHDHEMYEGDFINLAGV